MVTDALIGARVNGVMFRKRIPQTKLAARLGISQSALSKKLHGDRPWTTDDIYDTARLLRVPVEELLPPLAEVLPHLDSNQKPFGYRLQSPPING